MKKVTSLEILDINGIIRVYNEQLHAKIIDNLDEIEHFLKDTNYQS